MSAICNTATKMDPVVQWISDNAPWIFSGAGATIIGFLLTLLLRRKTTDRRAPPFATILTDLDRRMGDLFDAFRTGLTAYPFVREFFVVGSKAHQSGFITKDRFRYNADEIPGLRGKLDILESRGCVHAVRRSETPIYRLEEDFVAYLVGKLR